jgi:hypothetical protein
VLTFATRAWQARSAGTRLLFYTLRRAPSKNNAKSIKNHPALPALSFQSALKGAHPGRLSSSALSLFLFCFSSLFFFCYRKMKMSYPCHKHKGHHWPVLNGPGDHDCSGNQEEKNAVEIWKRLCLYHISTARRRRGHDYRKGTEKKQTIEPTPDISTLHRIGHFYSALTSLFFFLHNRLSCGNGEEGGDGAPGVP